MVRSLARTTSVLPAAATSRSTPEPIWPRIMPLLESTSAAHRAPSQVISSSMDCLIFAIEIFPSPRP
ncbi:hypothetical protein D3C86_919560 [compost metagenome]